MSHKPPRLLGLNLSTNQFTGIVPKDIGGLKSLVSRDLSGNKFWGTIPGSIAHLYSSAHLNLSCNNLSGPIPTGNQLQTLNDPSMYPDNPYLHGDPLRKKCTGTDEKQKGSEDDGDQDEEDDRHEMWFYLVVMLRFAARFWRVLGILLVKRSWRHALFSRIEDIYDWVCVAIALRIAKLKKK